MGVCLSSISSLSQRFTIPTSADWGTAYVMATKLGPMAQVLIDLGHHPQGTNIEFIVAYLIDEGKLGGFHFNCRKFADDDLTVGSVNPQELFLIYTELAAAETGSGYRHGYCLHDRSESQSEAKS